MLALDLSANFNSCCHVIFTFQRAQDLANVTSYREWVLLGYLVCPNELLRVTSIDIALVCLARLMVSSFLWFNNAYQIHAARKKHVFRYSNTEHTVWMIISTIQVQLYFTKCFSLLTAQFLTSPYLSSAVDHMVYFLFVSILPSRERDHTFF